MSTHVECYDRIIIGAGLYGLYAAERCGARGERALVIERDPAPFMRATHINQARVHMGYHYPRSLSTALKSAGYFRRFLDDYGFCVKTDFDQVYATSTQMSWTNAGEFRRFCEVAGIRCDEVDPRKWFKPGLVDGAFLTEEYTYDAFVLRDWLVGRIAEYPSVTMCFGRPIQSIEQDMDVFKVGMGDGGAAKAPFVLNATYAAVNDIHAMLGYEPFPIKYELCEIILCDVAEAMRSTGLTVMDGPFFSVMPFGLTGTHSLTSVTFTPHETSYDSLPTFACQEASEGVCSPRSLYNCDLCPAKPASAWPYMSTLARKYMRDDLPLSYRESLFSMKPILSASEIDDSRPTVIKVMSESPFFVSVLSGKINTVYDLDRILDAN